MKWLWGWIAVAAHVMMEVLAAIGSAHFW